MSTLQVTAAQSNHSLHGQASRPSVDRTSPDKSKADIADVRASGVRSFDSSAVDLTEAAAGAVSSLEIPHTLTSDRPRRRSDFSRIRPLDSPPAIEPESIELPVIQEHTREGKSSSLSLLGVNFHEDIIIPSKDDDVEIAPSFPSSLAPSIRNDEDVDSIAAISPAQKAVHNRKILINFATLCFSTFMNGWNDGTTGPLLPVFQSHYHVRQSVVVKR